MKDDKKRYMKKARRLSQKKRIVTYLVFVIYLVILIWIILFKLADCLEKIPNMRGINIIPFHYEERNGINLSHSLFHWKEILFNILIFVPAGYYWMYLFQKNKAVKTIICCFSLSLLFETFHYIFSFGISDITDLLTNVAGGSLGELTYYLMNKLFRDKHIRIANCIGGTLEIVGVVSVFVLIVFN